MAGEDNTIFDQCVRDAGVTTARAQQILRGVGSELSSLNPGDRRDLYTLDGGAVSAAASGNIPELSAQIGMRVFEQCMTGNGLSGQPRVTYPAHIEPRR